MRKLEKQEIPCNVCNGIQFKILYPDELGDLIPPVDYNFTQETRKTYQIVRCCSCGFIFTNPMPSLKDCYVENVDEVYLKSTAQRRVAAQMAVKQIVKLKSSGKLLDVGCAIGLFLDEAKNYFDVTGIELSNWAANIAGKQHKVFRNPLNHLDLKEQFDVITLWGVIEHFDDPRVEMEAVYAALKKGGIVVVYTGDVEAWLPRLLGKKWWWYQGMHLAYFSRLTLSNLLESIGFDVLKCQNYCSYFQLFSLANSLNRYKFSKFLSPILNFPWFRDIMVPIKLSGEMVLYAVKS